MTVYNYTSLSDICDECELTYEPEVVPGNDGAATGTAKGRAISFQGRFPRWKSFAQWIGSDAVGAAAGHVVRVSPGWFKPIWGRIDDNRRLSSRSLNWEE